MAVEPRPNPQLPHFERNQLLCIQFVSAEDRSIVFFYYSAQLRYIFPLAVLAAPLRPRISENVFGLYDHPFRPPQISFPAKSTTRYSV